MRIISGKFRGKKLIAPKKLPVRPTTDFAKEALFNILNNDYYLDQVHFMDLFAGTGNISFEFASRGCTHIVAVDAHAACIQFIEKTADLLSLNITVIKGNVFQFLEKTREKKDIIFADPPYDMDIDKFEHLNALIFENDLLSEEGVFIIEHTKHLDLSHLVYFSHSRKYGGSVFSFFQY